MNYLRKEINKLGSIKELCLKYDSYKDGEIDISIFSTIMKNIQTNIYGEDDEVDKFID